MLRLMMALQSAGAGDIPADFDLKKVQPAADASAIVVTAQRRNQRIERAPPPGTEPPLGKAEFRLFGQVKANVHAESQGFANGTTSQRVMVGIKLPF
ncbi:hypothetical protein GL174_08420 [Sphingobium sp. CAP-1]|nr:hypothetical protein GL174_08420 [Sphingobium sp. CAP-1]